MNSLLDSIRKIEHGFRHIIEAGNFILADKAQSHFDLATKFLTDDSYQVRMLATCLLGQLSADNPKAIRLLTTKVAADKDWRVQEMLAKAFDHYCKSTGYEKTLPVIKKWLSNKNPSLKRAVIEGLRIWTSRPYFKENPETAIQLIAGAKSGDNEYLKKSVGNALRDIRKQHKALVDAEVMSWNRADKHLAFIQKLVEK